MCDDPYEAFWKSPYDGFGMAMDQRDAAMEEAERFYLFVTHAREMLPPDVFAAIWAAVDADEGAAS